MGSDREGSDAMDYGLRDARGGLRLLLDHLGAVGDPHEPCKVKYLLREVLFLVTCATIAGGWDPDLIDVILKAKTR